MGFICGFINRFLSCFLFKNKWKVFIKDIIMGIVFSLAVYSYVISFANYKVLRWYNVMFAFIGMVLFTPCFDKAIQLCIRITGVTVEYFLKKTAIFMTGLLGEQKRKIVIKYQKNTQKNEPEYLHEEDIILYN
ncbi:MAG: spore cortex biosynthesis protein YabQ [Oscillospiraceae bacterium]|nr:spore cortex biosynthesis protein YabQ [Oscillospiraceae bacterium]